MPLCQVAKGRPSNERSEEESSAPTIRQAARKPPALWSRSIRLPLLEEGSSSCPFQAVPRPRFRERSEWQRLVGDVERRLTRSICDPEIES